jgi:hypothetical protein
MSTSSNATAHIDGGLDCSTIRVGVLDTGPMPTPVVNFLVASGLLLLPGNKIPAELRPTHRDQPDRQPGQRTAGSLHRGKQHHLAYIESSAQPGRANDRQNDRRSCTLGNPLAFQRAAHFPGGTMTTIFRRGQSTCYTYRRFAYRQAGLRASAPTLGLSAIVSGRRPIRPSGPALYPVVLGNH